MRWIDPTGLDFSDDWAAQDEADTENTSYFTSDELASMGYTSGSGDSEGSGDSGDSGKIDDGKQTEKDSTINTPNKTVVDDDLPLYQIAQILIQEETRKLENEVQKLENEINKASPDKKEQLQTEKEMVQKQIDDNYKSLVMIQNAIKELSGDHIRAEIAKHAASLANSKYVRGGNEKGAIDCSGTVFYSFNKAGVNLADMTAKGYHDMMTIIDKSELRPGDIITYSNSKGEITHVQVYIGESVDRNGNLVNDAVINAGSEKTGVYVISLDEYNSWPEINNNLTPHYGDLLGAVK